MFKFLTTISKFQLFHFCFPFQFSFSAFRFRFPFHPFPLAYQYDKELQSQKEEKDQLQNRLKTVLKNQEASPMASEIEISIIESKISGVRWKYAHLKWEAKSYSV